MEWRDVSFTVGDKEILKGVTGILERGRVVAVMGPSGCGKTTLLNVLSGRQRSSGKQKGKTTSVRVSVKGSITVLGEETKAKHVQKMVAYVFQDNALPEFETPRDCLNFSAFLRLPKSVTGGERKTVVQSMLDRLRLGQCSDIIVGSVTRKGLSGGEQKRTAVGVELISNPKMVFLDEPLSGLDSFNAVSLMHSLRELATADPPVPVLLTLHQPSDEIFSVIDDLILMHAGEVCYAGPADQLAAHFDVLGIPCPEGWSPTDHAMSVLETEEASRVKETWRTCGAYHHVRARINNITGTPVGEESEDIDTNSESDTESEESDTETSDDNNNKKARGSSSMRAKRQKGCCASLSALIGRDLRRVRRTFWQFLTSYVLQNLVVAIAYSILFFGAGRKETDRNSPSCYIENFNLVKCSQLFTAHIKFLSMVCFCVIFGAVPYAIETLQSERSVFLRERAGGYYEVIPYFFSKMIFEIPQVFLTSMAILVGTYWLVGLQGNFFWLLLELMVLAITASSMNYIFSAGCSTPDKANGYAGLPMTLQFAFSGVLIPVQSIPAALRWLKWLCPLYYGVGLLGVTEFHYVFKGLEDCHNQVHNFTSMNITAEGYCRTYSVRVNQLETFGIRPGEFWWPNMAMCAIMTVGFRSIASILLYTQSRYYH